MYYVGRSKVILYTYSFILNRTWPVKCKHGQRSVLLRNCMGKVLINWDSVGEPTEISLQNNAILWI